MRFDRRRLTASLAVALVIQPAFLLTLVTCCRPAPQDPVAAGGACPMHHAHDEACPHAATHDATSGHAPDKAGRATRPDCRLTCGTERHAAALSQSPHGLPPVGIATAPVDGPVAVIRIGQPSTLVLASPPSPPPPRA